MVKRFCWSYASLFSSTSRNLLYETQQKYSASVGARDDVLRSSDDAAMDLALTARVFDGAQAERLGLVTRTFGDHRDLTRGAVEAAQAMADKDAAAVRGTKHVLLHARDNSVESSLKYVAVWNTALLKKEQILKQLAKAKAAKHKGRAKL